MSIAPCLTQAPRSKVKIDWQLAATLRASGLTYSDVAERVGARGGETIRAGLMRRGVTPAIRTTLLTRADKDVREAQAKLSEETRHTLATTVLRHSRALEKVQVKPNINAIKKLGQAIEPLARTAKIVHGWGDSKPHSLIQMQVLGDVRMDEMFQDAEIVSTTVKNLSPANDVAQLPDNQPIDKPETS